MLSKCMNYTIHEKQSNNANEDIVLNTIRDNDVYELLLRIPAGTVSTYGDIAKALGNPLASREIGKILGRNPNPIGIPCHRIVMSNGKVGGYIYGRNRKKELLENEGISFTNDSVNDFERVRTYPQ